MTLMPTSWSSDYMAWEEITFDWARAFDTKVPNKIAGSDADKRAQILTKAWITGLEPASLDPRAQILGNNTLQCRLPHRNLTRG